MNLLGGISSAPAPQAPSATGPGMGNPMMGPEPQGAPPPQQMGAPNMAPPSVQGPPPTPAQLRTARAHIDAIVHGLTGLVTKPRGELHKKDVFDAASEMIAKGAFPTPESKQQLIGELAKMPDDEIGIRKALGSLLMQAATVEHGLTQAEQTHMPPPAPGGLP